jgi:hypothetical protein
MALLLPHPDYMIDSTLVDLYRQFLASYADDPAVWKARPCDVASWWRRRSTSRIVSGDSGWKIVGPAAPDGRIEFAVAEPV